VLADRQGSTLPGDPGEEWGVAHRWRRGARCQSPHL